MGPKGLPDTKTYSLTERRKATSTSVGGVSDETVKYGYWFCATRTIE
jgi:hypothetical protein